MKISIGVLRRRLHEALLGEDGAGNQTLGQLLDALATQFSSKMQSQYPSAGDVIARESSDLKTQMTAMIKAAAAKVKMSAGA